MPLFDDSAARGLSVTGLTRRIKQVLEGLPELQAVTVLGEVSNYKRHTSGHIYFTLKDEQAQISCAMWRSSAVRNPFQDFHEGDQVEARGSISVYEARGSYQLIVDRMIPAGVGELYKRFQRLKQQLADEGLFDDERKRPLPAMPQCVALITSATGAVVRDVIRTLQRRQAKLKLLVIPTAVQGPEALPALLQALALAQRHPAVQAIVLARGGGSLEDLWCFNEERLARAIVACRVPVVSAIGHETDFTIADFVADLRASTPTAAAELISPTGDELSDRLQTLREQLQDALYDRIAEARLAIDELHSAMQAALHDSVQTGRQQLQLLHLQLQHTMQLDVQRRRASIASYAATLQAQDPNAVLARGYAILSNGTKRIRLSNELNTDERIEAQLQDGKKILRVE